MQNDVALLAALFGHDALWWLLLVWVTAIGACVGSFLNVVIYRWPREMSLVRPGSHCPHCGKPVRWYYNLPVVGWLMLAGRCKDCGGPISARYPLVEGAVAAAFAALAVTGPLSTRAPDPGGRLAGAADPWPELAIVPWMAFVHHVVMFCLLLVLVLIQRDRKLTARRCGTLLGGALFAALVLGLVWPTIQPALAIEPVDVAPTGWRRMLLGTILGAVCGAALGWLSARGSGETSLPEEKSKSAPTGMTVPRSAPMTEHDTAGPDSRSAAAFAGALVGKYLGWQAACFVTIVTAAVYVPVLVAVMLFHLRRAPKWPAIVLPVSLGWMLTADSLHARWPQVGPSAGWPLLGFALGAAGLSCLAGWAYRRGRLH